MKGTELVDELRAACDKLDLSFDPAFTALWREAADRIEALEAALAKAVAEVERVQSDREYVIGWNAGFEHVNGPLRFPTMLRKMWSGSEVQVWLDEQRIEAARQAAADEGSALHQAEARATKAEAALAKAVKALKEIEDHPENSSGTSRSYGIGWAFWNVQNIARRARTATPETESNDDG